MKGIQAIGSFHGLQGSCSKNSYQSPVSRKEEVEAIIYLPSLVAYPKTVVNPFRSNSIGKNFVMWPHPDVTETTTYGLQLWG